MYTPYCDQTIVDEEEDELDDDSDEDYCKYNDDKCRFMGVRLSLGWLRHAGFCALRSHSIQPKQKIFRQEYCLYLCKKIDQLELYLKYVYPL